MQFSQMSGSYWNALCSLDCVDRGKLVDPFYQLEHMGEDVAKAKKEAPLLVRLQQSSDLKHSDNYARNKALRADLRVCLYCYPSQLLYWSSLESECGIEYFSYHLWEREEFDSQWDSSVYQFVFHATGSKKTSGQGGNGGKEEGFGNPVASTYPRWHYSSCKCHICPQVWYKSTEQACSHPCSLHLLQQSHRAVSSGCDSKVKSCWKTGPSCQAAQSGCCWHKRLGVW